MKGKFLENELLVKVYPWLTILLYILLLSELGDQNEFAVWNRGGIKDVDGNIIFLFRL